MTNFGNAQQKTELFQSPPTSGALGKWQQTCRLAFAEYKREPATPQKERGGEVKVQKRAMPRQKLSNVSEVQSTQAKLSPEATPLKGELSLSFGSFSGVFSTPSSLGEVKNFHSHYTTLKDFPSQG